ncbi:MAG: aminotransferase class I/II-fold pyridoxal phosphate-dependent enzyme [Microbacterium sp.]|uniref:aminotransferase class I/II-fold pyridoxal phosphate-dependent enzyme n=1 Tax=Microbacterium sp. TaxID=51671 RepID=UPI0039E5A570
MTTATEITGATATEIAGSVRALAARGELRPGDALPPVRALAEHLGLNRNTVVAAYRQLAQAGVVVARGRTGTRIADRARVAQEGFAPDAREGLAPGTREAVVPGALLRDVGTGNPDPDLIPDLAAALGRIAGRPVLYGEPVIEPGLADWADEWMREALDPALPVRLTITSGASDGVERLLAQTLTRGDAVALEDPCFLTSMNTVRLGGYRAVPVPVDAEGMTVAGLRDALGAGVRAVVCTPRAQNPTGASLSAERAAALREVLADHPYALVIEDDHFSMLSAQPYRSLIGPGHRRWALIRSVSKFLGPDMCLAVVASDPETADTLALRLRPGTAWVSHLLQRLAHLQLTDPAALARIRAAGSHYAERNAAFARLMRDRGLPTDAGDGLSTWVRLPVPARGVAERLLHRGWLARAGDEFVLADPAAASCLRLTVHALDDAHQARLADDLVAAMG